MKIGDYVLIFLPIQNDNSMDVLNQIVEGLSKEEIRFYKIFAHRQQGISDRKDVALLDMLRKNPGLPDDKAFRKLYADGDKNAYYRLRNRLMDELNRSLHLQHYLDDDWMQLLHLFALVKVYTAKGQNDLAFHFLRKAEQKAQKAELHEFLDLLYGEFIRLSHEMLLINPETYIELRRQNQEAISRLRQMDDLLAVVSYRLKITQNFDDKENSLSVILEKATEGFRENESLLQSARFRIKLYNLVSQMLLQKKDYPALEEYLVRTYAEFNRDQLFNKNTHDVRLQMLTYLVNSSFVNGKNEASLHYAALLHDAMEAYGRMHYERYEIFYYNALVNNYSKSDIPRAIEILQQLLQKPNIKKVPFYELFIYLNLATSYFDLRQYNLAIRQLSKALLLDAYKKADLSLQFKMATAELIIRFELGDPEFWLYRRDQLKKQLSDAWASGAHPKESQLVALMEQALPLDGGLGSRKMHDALQQYLQRWQNTEQEHEVINYVNWIKDKLPR